MLSSNVKVKSVLLALAMLVTTSSKSAENPAPNTVIITIAGAGAAELLDKLTEIAKKFTLPTASAAADTAADTVATTFIKFVANNKMLVGLVTGATTAMLIRLWTKPRPENAYQLDQWKDDTKKLLKSCNIFNTKLYKKLVRLVDKWLIGLELKIEETKTRTKSEDGSVFILNGKKLIQKPFGLVGLFDAYVLKQLKKTNELMPLLIVFSLLLLDPLTSFKNAVKGAK